MTTHAQLKADIATYMARDDLSDVIPTIIRLAEAMIRDDIRVRAMETTTTLTFDGQTVALPSGFLQSRRLYLDDTADYELDMVSPDAFWRDARVRQAGKPSIYAVEGNNIVLGPYPASTMYGKLLYFKAFDALSGEADTNWLLTNHYDVYLFACLSQTKAFIEDDEQASKWASAYQKIAAAANKTAWKGRFSGSLRAGGCPV